MAGWKRVSGVDFTVVGLVVSMIGGVSSAAADSTTLDNARKGQEDQYWTSERLRQALPMPLPEREKLPVTETALAPPPANSAGSERVVPSVKPSRRLRPLRNNRVFAPLASYIGGRLPPAPVPVANAAGGNLAHYSSSRLVPLSADLVYPYATVGRLFFHVPAGTGRVEGEYFCSAAVIGRRIILTAGHCVHSGMNGEQGYFSNWRFIPAFRDGNAPYGSWNARGREVTAAWRDGGGNIPNAADYALLIMNDTNLNGRTRKLGNTVGMLGVMTRQLESNHVHMIGYPCNIDNCNKMHQVTAQSYLTTGSNTVEYGSDMNLGSSGAPWIQNFGLAGQGQPAGESNREMNMIVGLTSYGFEGSNILLQGSSVPDERFWEMWDKVCAANSSDCI